MPAALPSPAETSRRIQEAVIAGDPEAVAAQFAVDAVLYPPTSDLATLHGRTEIRELYSAVLGGGLVDLQYTAEVGDGDERALIVRYQVGGRTAEEAIWLRFGEDGLVSEMRSFVRPLVGLTALSAAVVPRYARAHAPWRAPVMTVMLRPLAVLTAIGDRFGARLAGIRARS